MTSFTIEQINDLHGRLGTMQTLPDYLRALNAIGVARFDSFLRDGHSEFFDGDGHSVESEAAHEVLAISDVGIRDQVAEHLARHQQGETSYVEMSKSLAASGVEKWTMDTNAMTVAYFDKLGNALLVESVR